jgi:hypothetical protein
MSHGVVKNSLETKPLGIYRGGTDRSLPSSMCPSRLVLPDGLDVGGTDDALLPVGVTTWGTYGLPFVDLCMGDIGRGA